MAAIHQLPGAAAEPVQQIPRKRAKYSSNVAILQRARNRRNQRAHERPVHHVEQHQSTALEKMGVEVMTLAIFARGLVQTAEKMQELLKGMR
jgi:hypothetical protein